MSRTASALQRARAASSAPHSEHDEHIHLPSVHIRDRNGTGFNYDEDIFFVRQGRRYIAHRVVKFAFVESLRVRSMRETRDVLCREELVALAEILPVVMDEENPAGRPLMEEAARREFERQCRIASGEERACLRCGCSETRACSGNCIWATENLCSRCA